MPVENTADLDRANEERARAKRAADEAEALRKEREEKAEQARLEAERLKKEEEEAKRRAEEARKKREKEKAEEELRKAEEARKALEKKKEEERLERERLRKAAEEAKRLREEEEKRAREAAAAKAAKLKKIREDYKKRRIQFTEQLGTKFFGGSGKEFAKQMQFHVLTYYSEAGDKKEEAIYFKESNSFKSNSLKTAFETFASKIRSEIVLMPLREFALIGNRRLLLTTSIYDDFFEKPIAAGERVDKNQKYNYTFEEYKDDRIARLFIGFGFQKHLLDWPDSTLDQDFEGYQVLQVIGKEGTWTKVGPNYQKAQKVFEEKAQQDQAYCILTHTGGKWYKVSGTQNTNLLWLDAYLGLSGYLQGKGSFLGPFVSELKAGFKMKWQQEAENKAKFDKLKAFYTGDGAEKLYRQYTIYGLSYDKRTHAVARLNWKSYYYMKKGLADVADTFYHQIIKPNKEMAYMALVRETVPLYCSEGDMAKKHICQRLIGYALSRKWLYADRGMTYLETAASDRSAYHYVAYLGNSDKQDEAVIKQLHWDKATAVKQYQDFFRGADAAFDYGVMGHTAIREFWEWKTLYSGEQKNMDCYRLLALWAQSNLNVYKSDAADEAAAKVVTQKAHDEKLKAKVDEMNGVYKGKGEALHKAVHFFIATLDRKTRKVSRPYDFSSANAKDAVTRLAQWAFNNILQKEAPLEYIFGVRETGHAFYCSAGDLTTAACSQAIGYSLFKGYLAVPNAIADPYMAPHAPDYKYYAVVQNTVNPGADGPKPERVNLTADLTASLEQYRALFAVVDGKQKFDTGVMHHYSLPQYYEPHTSIEGLGAGADVWEMIARWAQSEHGAYGKPAVASEEGLGLETVAAATKKRDAVTKRLRGLYNGTSPTLYKHYTFYASAIDLRTRAVWTLARKSANNMKAGLEVCYTAILDQIVKPQREAAYAVFVRETMPLYCSEEFNSTACRVLIGKAIREQELHLDNKMHHNNAQNVVNFHMTSNNIQDWKWVAYVRNFD